MKIISHMNQPPNQESFVQSLKAYFLGIVLLKALGFVRNIAFARMLGPTEYGKFTLVFGLVAIIEPIAVIGIPGVFMRFIPRYQEGNALRLFFKKLFLYACCGLCAGGGVLVLFSSKIASTILKDQQLSLGVALAGLSLIPFGLFHLVYTAFQGMRSYKRSILSQIVQVSLYLLLGIFLIGLFGNHQAGIIAFAFSCAVLPVFFFGKFHLYVPSTEQGGTLENGEEFLTLTLRFGIWILLIDAGYELFKYVDKYFINSMLSANEVGIYSAAFSLASPLFFVGILFGETLLPHLSAQFDRGEKEAHVFAINAIVKLALLILCNTVAFLAFFRVPIISVLFGVAYVESATLFPYLLFYFSLFSVNMILMIYMYLIEKPFLGLISILTGVGIICVANILLIPLWGLVGAAVAASLGILTLVFMTSTMAHRLGFRFDGRLLPILLMIIVASMGTPISLAIIMLSSILIAFTSFIVRKEEKEKIITVIRGFWKKDLAR